MRLHSLRPVGEPIICKKSSQNPAVLFKPCHATFYGSGTAALAAAIATAIKRSDCPRPEVILPAYGCPSLVSAVLFNAAKPVLVDLAPDQICLDIDRLKAALNANTVAVISVDLFGLPSLTPTHRELINRHPCSLIHDCAQATFTPERAAAVENELVVLSFGRGKPVSILTGGAVLTASNQHLPHAVTYPPAKSSLTANLLTWLKYQAYNLIIDPRVYWLTNYLPLKTGETHYEILHEIGKISPAALPYLHANLIQGVNRLQPLRFQYTQLFKSISGDGWIDLCQNADPQNRHKLLRYSILAPSKAVRDLFRQHGTQLGLGITSLYHQILPFVDSMPDIFNDHLDYPNAKSFSERLVTIPIHTDSDITTASTLRDLILQYPNTNPRF